MQATAFSPSTPPVRGNRSAFHMFWAAASLLALVSVAAFDLRILASPDSLQVQYSPDDAYYYLGLARNFAQTGQWSFDSGVSATTGFHPLYAYLLALFYGTMHPNSSQFVYIGLLFCSLLTLAIASIVWIIGIRRGRPEFLMVLALIVGSRFFLFNSVSMMEWPLVVCIASLYAIFFFHTFGRTRKRDILLLFCLGFAGSLARSDFGLWPFCVFLASCLPFRCGKDRWSLPATLSGLLGAIAGLVLVSFHNFFVSGQILQSSAEMKAHWLRFMGNAQGMSANVILKVFGMDLVDPLLERILFLLLIAGLGIFILLSLKRSVQARSGNSTASSKRGWTILLASAMAIYGYLFLYSRSWGVQSWYTANYIVPVFCLLWIGLEMAVEAVRASSKTAVRRLASAGILILAAVSSVQAQTISDSHSPWPHQQFMLEAGKYLAANPLDGRIGAWNAGIIGYYQGGEVVNIDGLVNDDIFPYAASNRLPEYLSSHNIRYIIDFDNMFFYSFIRMRGGFNDISFLESLQPIRHFGGAEYSWKNLTLYKIAAPGEETTLRVWKSLRPRHSPLRDRFYPLDTGAGG